MTFKCMNGMAPTRLSSRFVKRGTISGHSTRNTNNLDILHYKTACSGPAKFLVLRSNNLEQLAKFYKLSPSINIFKRKLRK